MYCFRMSIVQIHASNNNNDYLKESQNVLPKIERQQTETIVASSALIESYGLYLLLLATFIK